MVDSRLVKVDELPRDILEELGFEWFVDGENEGYLIDQFIRVNKDELKAFHDASSNVYRLAMKAAQYVSDNDLWDDVGIEGEDMIALTKWSLRHEQHLHLHGRFDFSGGMGSTPIKLLEFNADTCSLMPETAYIQEAHWQREEARLSGQPHNPLVEDLTNKFLKILQKYPRKEATLLVTTLGHDEDWLNAEVIQSAAREAGFTEVVCANLEQITFSADEGIFLEDEDGDFHKFEFLYKFIPWDFIVFEEPELLTLLSSIIQNDLGVVMNPAWTMLLQSKGLLKFMYDLDPSNKYLLKTTFESRDFKNRKYVRKPVFGRMGENISFFDGGFKAKYKTEGDYGDFDPVYQELAPFDLDLEGHRYQPSIYYTDIPSALCFRRQDDLIIDDDAEFVGHVITTGSVFY